MKNASLRIILLIACTAVTELNGCKRENKPQTSTAAIPAGDEPCASFDTPVPRGKYRFCLGPVNAKAMYRARFRGSGNQYPNSLQPIRSRRLSIWESTAH